MNDRRTIKEPLGSNNVESSYMPKNIKKYPKNL